MIAQYGSNGTREDARQRLADPFAANFEDPARITEVIDDVDKARGFISQHAGGSWLLPLLRGATGVGREQLRQALGGAPRYPTSKSVA